MNEPNESFAQDPGRVATLAADLRAGRCSAQSLLRGYLERIAAVDGQVQAWRQVDVDGALAQAQALDREARAGRWRGPLHGIPVAVKDVIDVAGLQTRCNSKALEEVAPASSDAGVVACLRAAGAVMLGKAHTTEFAFFDPSPARNPHDTSRTPGGSSSGSAAAVAAGMAAVALGTQTVASVNRPAAYCGIAAFKPSNGLLSTFGVTPLAPLFDTVGLFGFRVVDAVALFEAVCPPHAAPAAAAGEAALQVVVLRDPLLDEARPAVREALDAAAGRLRGAGHVVTERPAAIDFRTLCDRQMRCALYEMGRVHRRLLALPAEQVGEKLRAAIEEGQAIADGEYRALRGAFRDARAALFPTLGDADAVLWPAAPDTAPQGIAWTGDPRFISPWTALGGPLVTVRVGTDDAHLPVGALLAGAPGTDATFARVASRLAQAVEV